MRYSSIFILLFAVLFTGDLPAQNNGINTLSSSFKIVRLQYSGGGDWYNDPSAEVNMMDFLKKNTVIDIDEPKFIRLIFPQTIYLITLLF
jgi:hypothetical protein